jgi:hypothetical protein
MQNPRKPAPDGFFCGERASSLTAAITVVKEEARHAAASLTLGRALPAYLPCPGIHAGGNDLQPAKQA